MARFQFDLQLPDGRLTTETVIAESWRWWEAFDTACRHAELRHDLLPFSGIRCMAYRHEPIEAPRPLVGVAG